MKLLTASEKICLMVIKSHPGSDALTLASRINTICPNRFSLYHISKIGIKGLLKLDKIFITCVYKRARYDSKLCGECKIWLAQ